MFNLKNIDNIKIDETRNSLIKENGLNKLSSYLLSESETPQERYRYVSYFFASNEEHAQRMYDYSSKHYISYSTPILSFNQKNLPISCYLLYLDDTYQSLLDTSYEANLLTILGGGISVCMNIRSPDEKSTGVLAHAKTYDSSIMAYKQGKIRRGACALYLRIDHPEIENFIDMRKPTGDHNIRCHNIHNAVILNDKFMNIIEKCTIDKNFNDDWDLVEQNTGKIVKTVKAKELWKKILSTRMRTGEPYILFIDNCNKKMPQFLKNKGLKIEQSNLCTEIILPTNKERTAVCCLSSFNLEYIDEIKNYGNLIFDDLCEFLDNVLTYFINKASEFKGMNRAVTSSVSERSIGIGVMGYHSYLQSKNIPFEESFDFNKEVFEYLNKNINLSNLKLGKERGSPIDCDGTGRRFSCTMAIAPTASSSIIMGNTSPSCDPLCANIFRQDTKNGSFLYINKFLEKLILNKKLDLDDMINKISKNQGSIQKFKEFTFLEKKVFKTAFEIDQNIILQLARDRSYYIDQAQSLNLFTESIIDAKTLHNLHMNAWKYGLKTLYYQRTTKLREDEECSVCSS